MIYNGNAPYIFASYAHKDAATVLPILNSLMDAGFRVWYDSGIEAGTEWPEYIGERLMHAATVVVFMTPAAIASRNCRNEINFALELKKDVLVVYLEETELLNGMRLQLNSAQSLFRAHHTSDRTFLQELLHARILASCCDHPITAQMPSQTPSQIPSQKPVQRDASPVAIANVCSIGAIDDGDLWPQGSYSQTINRDVHRVVFFHIKLIRPIRVPQTVRLNVCIRNSNNAVVYFNKFSINMKSGNDLLSTGWILKGLDGTFVPSGDYRFVCSVDGSDEFSYSFTVTSNVSNTLSAPPADYVPQHALWDAIRKRL